MNLVGGSIALRVRHSKVPPLEAPFVLAPFRREGDAGALERFMAHRPLHVEIGFGRPHHLCDLAAARPDIHVLGFEIKRQWCSDASRRAAREGLENLRVIEGDARAYLARFAGPGSVDAYHVLFPDPWWKKRHHKRRVFQPDVVELMHRTLAPGGLVVFKTDVPAYADLVDEMMHSHPGFVLNPTPVGDDPILTALPRSHREKKCAEYGIPVWAYRFVRQPSSD